jgi:hypothetical protein
MRATITSVFKIRVRTCANYFLARYHALRARHDRSRSTTIDRAATAAATAAAAAATATAAAAAAAAAAADFRQLSITANTVAAFMQHPGLTILGPDRPRKNARLEKIASSRSVGYYRNSKCSSLYYQLRI